MTIRTHLRIGCHHHSGFYEYVRARKMDGDSPMTYDAVASDPIALSASRYPRLDTELPVRGDVRACRKYLTAVGSIKSVWMDTKESVVCNAN